MTLRRRLGSDSPQSTHFTSTRSAPSTTSSSSACSVSSSVSRRRSLATTSSPRDCSSTSTSCRHSSEGAACRFASATQATSASGGSSTRVALCCSYVREGGKDNAGQQLLAGGLGACADVGLAVCIAGDERAQHAGVGRLPLGVEENELIEPHDGGEADEAVVVVQEREKRVHQRVHHRRVHLAALDLREEGGQHVVRFLGERTGEGSRCGSRGARRPGGGRVRRLAAESTPACPRPACCPAPASDEGCGHSRRSRTLPGDGCTGCSSIDTA